MLAIQSELFLGGWNRSGSIGGLAVALYLGTVLVPRENPAWAAFVSLDIPFSTLRFLDCKDPGFAPRNGERWPSVTERL